MVSAWCRVVVCIYLSKACCFKSEGDCFLYDFSSLVVFQCSFTSQSGDSAARDGPVPTVYCQDSRIGAVAGAPCLKGCFRAYLSTVGCSAASAHHYRELAVQMFLYELRPNFSEDAGLWVHSGVFVLEQPCEGMVFRRCPSSLIHGA